jgi:hypothetical protein
MLPPTALTASTKLEELLEKKTALIIIFNHQYEKNIGVLESIYGGRFSNIFHLMPFYGGEKGNVIPVYENSRYFQGYLVQGYRDFCDDKFSHYLFLADDLMLNPLINESNVFSTFGLDEETSYINNFRELHTGGFWHRKREAYEFIANSWGSEGLHFLPTYDEALERLHHFNLDIQPLKHWQIYPKPSIEKSPRNIYRYFCYHFNKNKNYHLPYPLIGGYSDYFIVSAGCMKDFLHYCGIFASMRLFCELAIPTAMLLSSHKIRTLSDINFKGGSIWSKEELLDLEDQFDRDLKRLMNGFPEDILYYHPIKISKWKY